MAIAQAMHAYLDDMAEAEMHGCPFPVLERAERWQPYIIALLSLLVAALATWDLC